MHGAVAKCDAGRILASRDVMCWGVHRFGFVKFKTRAAATDALEKLAGKQLADFPGQNVSHPSCAYMSWLDSVVCFQIISNFDDDHDDIWIRSGRLDGRHSGRA